MVEFFLSRNQIINGVSVGGGNLFISLVVRYNRLDLCKIVSPYGIFKSTYFAVDEAARYGNLKVVEYLSTLGEICTSSAMDNAAIYGHLEVVEWLHLNRSEGCSSYALDEASLKGNLEIIKILHLRTEQCSTWAMDYAAKGGHLEIFKWLHFNRKEGYLKAFWLAARYNHLHVMKYMIDNNLKSDEKYFEYALEDAVKKGFDKVAEYLGSIHWADYQRNILNF